VPGVRTAVVTVSPLLAGLVTSVLQSHLPLDVIGTLRTRTRLAERLNELAPELVLLGLRADETDASALLLIEQFPSAKFLVLEPSGKHAWLYETGLDRTEFTDVSTQSLVTALASRFNITPPRG
jgi:hypothetical protein